MASGTRGVAAATISLAVLLLIFCFSPSTAPAAGVPSIDAARTRHLPLPRGLLRGPESVAFDDKGHDPYSIVCDGRVLKWNGHAFVWSTYTHNPDPRDNIWYSHP